MQAAPTHLVCFVHAHVLRNDRCPCGSGLKYKHCCLPALADHQTEMQSAITAYRLQASAVSFYLLSLD